MARRQFLAESPQQALRLIQQPVVERPRPQAIAELAGVDPHQAGGMAGAEAPGGEEAQEHAPVVLPLAQEDPEVVPIRLAEEPAERTARLPQRIPEVALEQHTGPEVPHGLRGSGFHETLPRTMHGARSCTIPRIPTHWVIARTGASAADPYRRWWFSVSAS